MKRIDLDRTIIEATVVKALTEIRADPERTLRKLVDMGQGFSAGPFQKRFFNEAQKMLENEESAYYRLLKHIVTGVDLDKLKTFGMNLGYNGCTKGANLIRRREVELGFNIPWALSFLLSKEEGCLTTCELDQAILQGKELGIYVYLLFYRNDNLENTLRLLEQHDDCAFILFLNPGYLTDSTVHALQQRANIMISVTADLPETENAVRTLREGQFLFSVHSLYSSQENGWCMSDAHMETISSYNPLFYFLIAAEGSSPESAEAMGRQVDAARKAQRYPVLPIDLAHDMLQIDHVVSDDACSVTFDEYGFTCDPDRYNRTDAYSIRKSSLTDILRRSNPKK